MWTLARRLVHTVDTLNTWVGNMLSLFIFALIGMIIYEVIARYFFDSPTIWVMQLSIMVHGGYMVAAAGPTLLEKGHVRMDLFYAKWSKQTQAIVDCLTFPLIIAFFTVLFWLASHYAIDSMKVNEVSHSAWQQPLYHWRIAIASGVGLLFLQGLANFIRDLKMAVTGERL